jgi:hypothetical protein
MTASKSKSKSKSKAKLILKDPLEIIDVAAGRYGQDQKYRPNY